MSKFQTVYSLAFSQSSPVFVSKHSSVCFHSGLQRDLQLKPQEEQALRKLWAGPVFHNCWHFKAFRLLEEACQEPQAFQTKRFLTVFLPPSVERKQSWYSCLIKHWFLALLFSVFVKTIPISEWPNHGTGTLLIMKNYFKNTEYAKIFHAAWMDSCENHTL